MKLTEMMDEYSGTKLKVVAGQSTIMKDEDFTGCLVYGVNFNGDEYNGVRVGPTIFMYCNFNGATFTDTKIEPGKPIVFAGCNNKGDVSGVDFLRRN